MHIARYKSVLVPRDCSKLIDPKKQEYVPEKMLIWHFLMNMRMFSLFSPKLILIYFVALQSAKNIISVLLLGAHVLLHW